MTGFSATLRCRMSNQSDISHSSSCVTQLPAIGSRCNDSFSMNCVSDRAGSLQGNAADLSANTTSQGDTAPPDATARADIDSVQPAPKKRMTAATALSADQVAAGMAGSPINLDTAPDAAVSTGRRITSGVMLSNGPACRYCACCFTCFCSDLLSDNCYCIIAAAAEFWYSVCTGPSRCKSCCASLAWAYLSIDKHMHAYTSVIPYACMSVRKSWTACCVPESNVLGCCLWASQLLSMLSPGWG